MLNILEHTTTTRCEFQLYGVGYVNIKEIELNVKLQQKLKTNVCKIPILIHKVVVDIILQWLSYNSEGEPWHEGEL